jgi:hypothetical protein
MWVEEASGLLVLAQDPSLYHLFGDLLKGEEGEGEPEKSLSPPKMSQDPSL